LLKATPQEQAFKLLRGELDAIVYEDGNLIIVDKQVGLSVHSDESKNPDTLIARIQSYLYKKGEWNPETENSFAPALCHRLDRNTRGLVIAAKNAAALREANEIIKNRQVKKYYICIANGVPAQNRGTLTGYIKKDEKNNRVEVFKNPVPGARTAITHYRVLSSRSGKSLIECELETGRTHQIRAQLAEIGCPLAGDTKYGLRDGREGGQALVAYKLVFDAGLNSENLSYLSGKVFEADKSEIEKEFLKLT
jgi:23S rRNA pseudouridine955/2504/2580 synthase